MTEGRRRVTVENVKPEIDCGAFPIKRVTGEKVVVEADIFSDGHDSVSARLLHRHRKETRWKELPLIPIGDDRWRGEFMVEEPGVYDYTLRGWVDHFRTWQKDLRKKYDAGNETEADFLIGLEYIRTALGKSSGKNRTRLADIISALEEEKDRDEAVTIATAEDLGSLVEVYADQEIATTYEKTLSVVVDRERALFSSWYEMFPRSCSPEEGKHGTFRDCENLLPYIQKMGFDILYLPPVHPIGRKNRKGKNNSLTVTSDDIGSPWAIGSDEGGHKSVHPDLGTLDDFLRFVDKAKEYDLEIAMDLAFQCSPDHPYVKEHPEWFTWRPDGSVQYAENPPKKYEDIIPLDFETEKWQELWNEMKDVVFFWINKGIRIFRVDNPHTKPFAFWQWLIDEVRRNSSGVIFLAEAFTRPKVMYRLAKIGFTQSYTYFTWRNTKSEIMRYINELTETDLREYFRPNFWPNTPDILPEHLQYGGRNAFAARLVLAATLSSNYGIYGPAFELAVAEAVPGKEEYLNSEKYEIRKWDRDREGNLKDFIARVNRIRKENPALHTIYNISYYEVDNDNLLCYGKKTEDLSNILLIVVNLDPFHTHSGWVKVPVRDMEIDPAQPYIVHDLLSDDKYIWQGERNYVELNPSSNPAHIFRIRKRLKREADFDYFM
jgi:starch synthase (maltosyl-transferring)